MATTKTETMTEGKDEIPFIRDLALAQAEMENAAYNRINPHFKSKYADFAAVRAATLPALNKYGFAVTQSITESLAADGTTCKYVRTFLWHKSLANPVTACEYLIPRGTPQQEGSAITYARRYSWSAICGIASEEDDDANEAMNAGVKQKSAYQARADKDYETLVSEMHQCRTRNELFEWRKQIMSRRAALPDSWRDLLDEQSEIHRLNLIDLEKEKEAAT